MKGFIEIKEKNKGTMLINVSNIFYIKPMLGTTHSTTKIVLTMDNCGKEILEFTAEEPYSTIKSLIEAAVL